MARCSRYLFFLARCHHAPAFCGRLFRRSKAVPINPAGSPQPNDVLLDDSTGTSPSQDHIELGILRTPPPQHDQVPQFAQEQNSTSPPTSAPLAAATVSLAVPPDSHHARPRALRRHRGSDASAGSGSADSEGGSSGPPTPRIQRKKEYDHSKTVPWVVSR